MYTYTCDTAVDLRIVCIDTYKDTSIPRMYVRMCVCMYVIYVCNVM